MTLEHDKHDISKECPEKPVGELSACREGPDDMASISVLLVLEVRHLQDFVDGPPKPAIYHSLGKLSMTLRDTVAFCGIWKEYYDGTPYSR